MRIFITGGTGYIGSHCAALFLGHGHEVTLYDNLHNSKSDVVDRLQALSKNSISLIEGDIRDEALVLKSLKSSKTEVVLHCAGLKSISESMVAPDLYDSVNVGGLRSLTQAMQEAGIHKIIFSGSANVYGQPLALPITEDAPVNPQSPYGKNKLEGEHILKTLTKRDSQWSVVVLRYFNPVGAHHSGLIGENPKGIPNNLMPILCQVALGERSALDIYGHDYATSDGTAIRDYVHIEDLSEAHLGALNLIINTQGFNLFNIGSSKGVSVMEMVQCFKKSNSIEIPYRFVARRSGDIEALYTSNESAKNKLQWNPRQDIEAMCESAWNYFLRTRGN
jgi:UDP-glucose 4-epimerase